MRDFVLKMCMDGKIVVNEDLRELNQELRRQGNNLNQLVRLVHQRRISAVDLSELLDVYRKILLATGYHRLLRIRNRKSRNRPMESRTGSEKRKRRGRMTSPVNP